MAIDGQYCFEYRHPQLKRALRMYGIRTYFQHGDLPDIAVESGEKDGTARYERLPGSNPENW